MATEGAVSGAVEEGRPPELTPAAASQLVLSLFPFKSVSANSFKSLPSYDDRNLYFTGTLEKDEQHPVDSAEKERAFVLKLYNRNLEPPRVLDGLNAIMRWLSERGVPCSCPVTCRDGRYTARTPLSGGKGDSEVFVVTVVSFMPGGVMDKLEKKYLTPSLAFSVGEMVGNVDKNLQVFSHPAIDHRRLDNWDLMHFTTDVKEFIPHLKEDWKIEMASSIVSMFEVHVQPLLPKMRKGITHNDMNGLNILFTVSENDHCELTGLIDFGDCVHSCYLFELAIMLAYGMVEKENPVEFVGPMFQGYHSVFPLSQEELGCLYYAVLARLCQSAVNGEYRYTLEPWNSYLLTTPPEAWKLMKMLLSLGKKCVDEMWGVV